MQRKVPVKSKEADEIDEYWTSEPREDPKGMWVKYGRKKVRH